MEQNSKEKTLIQKIVNEHEIKISQKMVKSFEKYKQKHSKFEDLSLYKSNEGKNLFLRYFFFLSLLYFSQKIM